MKEQKNLFTLIFVFTFLLVNVFIFSALYGGDLPALKGITTKDDRPNGCVDCHKKISADKDYSIPAELAKVDGHPKVNKIVKVVPKDCMKCHKEGRKSGPIGPIVHEKHFENPSENHFVKKYGGDCLNCHSLDLKTGVMSVKSGNANW